VVAYSSRLREAGDFVPARRSLRLARAMAERTGAPREVVDVTDRLLELYGRMSFPAPRAVLELATVDHGIDALDATADPVGWYAMCNRAVSAMGMATQVADGALVVAAGRLVERVAAAGPAEPDPMAEMLMAMLRSSAAQAHVLGPLYAARAARRDGDSDRAAPLEREALTAAEAMGSDGLLLRAVVLGTLGRKEEALTIVEQLREQLPPDQLRLLYIRLGATDRAVWTLPPVDPPSDRPWEAWSHRAQIYAGEERWQDAADAADAGIEAFETTLTRYARDALKTSATEDLDAADMYLARILADLPAAIRGDATAVRRAFGTSDRARSISNVERIGSERSEPDVRRWLALGSRWAAAYEGLSSRAADVASIDVDATRRQLRAVEDDLDEAEDTMLGAHPELLELLRSRRPPLDVGAVARALPDAALLLQFHCWNDELVSWALTTDRCTIHRVRVDAKSVASDGRRFLRACAGRREWEPALAASLSELLLGPWSELLDQHERVVFVPHAALTGVPLHLLAVGGAMLADRHVVSYAPSSSHVLTLADGPAPGSSGRAAVVGDPAYAPDRGLSRLAGSGVEARAVAATLGAGSALTGGAATREAVLAQGAGASVVHLGTHGVLDERAPNRSFLALAGTDALTPADLFGVDIDGSMVVMSACNSGRGTATAGGDVVGLTRAVLASGAGSVVASLWPVGDEAGCLIMSGFYEHLVGSESRPPVPAARALHRAAADVRAMSRRDRRDAYEELAERVGAEGAPAGVRDAGAADAGAPVAAPDESTAVAAWAPFVYVGR
jgi:CHAT domain-containing protein/tetratricopeptide (TPR) repeat protein